MDKEQKQRGISVPPKRRGSRAKNYDEWKLKIFGAKEDDPLVKLLWDGMQAREWTASDLARAIGGTGSQVSRWMQGNRPSPETLHRLSIALGLDLIQMLVAAEYIPQSEVTVEDERTTMIINKVRQLEMTDEKFAALNGVLEAWRKRPQETTTKTTPRPPKTTRSPEKKVA